MRIITARDDGFVLIGRQGENAAAQVQFPVVEEWTQTYGSGVFQLLILRPTEATPYAVPVSADADNVAWTVSKTDVAIPGIGGCELRYVVDGTVAKSQTYVTLTDKSIGGSEAPYPTPWEEWVDQVLAAAASAEAYAGSADASADEAAYSASAAETAQRAAEVAQAAAEAAKEAADADAAAALEAKSSAQTSASSAASAAFDADGSRLAAETAAASASGSASAASSSAAAAASSRTAAEYSKLAAENAQTAAESAKTAAERAQGVAAASEMAAGQSALDAETSRIAASAAESAAETAAASASGSASSASTSAAAAASSASAASSSAAAAETAQTAAEAAQTAAENAQTAAETAADTVQSAAAEISALRDDTDTLQTVIHAQLVPVVFAPSLKKGEYFKFADGAAASSNKYARTTSLWDGFRVRTAVRFDSEVYECALSFYGADGTTSGTGYLGHTEYGGGIRFIPAEAVRFGVSFRRVDQAALSDADVTAISAALSAFAQTDPSLTLRGAAADAAIVGERFSFLRGTSLWLYGYSANTILRSTGNTSSDPDYDTIDFVPVSPGDIIYGRGARFCCFASDQTTVVSTGVLGNLDTVIGYGCHYYIIPDNAAYFRIAVFKSSPRILAKVNPYEYWLDQRISELESPALDMTARTNIDANTYFAIGNNLYKSTEAIASGTTIIPGTNCTATNIAAALNTLAASIN